MDINTYISSNPYIWDKFKEYVFQAAEKRDHFSSRTIIERIRWETMLHETERQFKINNNIAPKLARKIMEEYPGLKGFFNTRDK